MKIINKALSYAIFLFVIGSKLSCNKPIDPQASKLDIEQKSPSPLPTNGNNPPSVIEPAESLDQNLVPTNKENENTDQKKIDKEKERKKIEEQDKSNKLKQEEIDREQAGKKLEDEERKRLEEQQNKDEDVRQNLEDEETRKKLEEQEKKDEEARKNLERKQARELAEEQSKSKQNNGKNQPEIVPPLGSSGVQPNGEGQPYDMGDAAVPEEEIEDHGRIDYPEDGSFYIGNVLNIKYLGGVLNRKRQGLGILFNSSNEVISTGFWQNNEFVPESQDEPFIEDIGPHNYGNSNLDNASGLLGVGVLGANVPPIVLPVDEESLENKLQKLQDKLAWKEAFLLDDEFKKFSIHLESIGIELIQIKNLKDSIISGSDLNTEELFALENAVKAKILSLDKQIQCSIEPSSLKKYQSALSEAIKKLKEEHKSIVALAQAKWISKLDKFLRMGIDRELVKTVKNKIKQYYGFISVSKKLAKEVSLLERKDATLGSKHSEIKKLKQLYSTTIEDIINWLIDELEDLRNDFISSLINSNEKKSLIDKAFPEYFNKSLQESESKLTNIKSSNIEKFELQVNILSTPLTGTGFLIGKFKESQDDEKNRPRLVELKQEIEKEKAKIQAVPHQEEQDGNVWEESEEEESDPGEKPNENSYKLKIENSNTEPEQPKKDEAAHNNEKKEELGGKLQEEQQVDLEVLAVQIKSLQDTYKELNDKIKGAQQEIENKGFIEEEVKELKEKLVVIVVYNEKVSYQHSLILKESIDKIAEIKNNPPKIYNKLVNDAQMAIESLREAIVRLANEIEELEKGTISRVEKYMGILKTLIRALKEKNAEIIYLEQLELLGRLEESINNTEDFEKLGEEKINYYYLLSNATSVHEQAVSLISKNKPRNENEDKIKGMIAPQMAIISAIEEWLENISNVLTPIVTALMGIKGEEIQTLEAKVKDYFISKLHMLEKNIQNLNKDTQENLEHVIDILDTPLKNLKLDGLYFNEARNDEGNKARIENLKKQLLEKRNS